jgi:hypothetical protein
VTVLFCFVGFTGVAVSADNVLYFADGTNIRMVDRDGIVTTVIGNHMHKSHWKPIPCEGTLNVEEVLPSLYLTYSQPGCLKNIQQNEYKDFII